MTTSHPATGLRSARRTFRRILHPDMTPMVGLGFLLVTFFLLTAEFSKSTALQLLMPAKAKADDIIVDRRLSDVVTLILGKNGQVHYYKGGLYSDDIPELQTVHDGSAGLRRLLLEVRQRNPNTIVIIKPSNEAKYRDLVDALDEMSITNQRHYALADMYRGDYDLLKQHGL
ncbi:ExbD/TolR family protein [Hymenobacter cellulosilyticus]|uniref:Biopolymer transporter ExbD n=1 Tax=Hymenobacter cellulosilyticus TaxID=2932248 RepID=A0A8T9Q7T2_9BACT|nr:biopolymer transporter ExbD [Hymenobacter cellulosilyticus]UOQ72982.1 biopolymer transporter ExbD [Hymenobacter cellulosilyticus]